MFRVSNVLIGLLNCVTLILSFISIGISVWFQTHVHGGSTECQKVMQMPLLVLGIFLLVVSLIGLMGSCCKVRILMFFYSFVTLLLMLGLICFMVFALLVTNKGVGKVVSNTGFKEYKLGDYSHWLQKYVVNGKNWDEIRSCLIDANVCKSLGNGNGVHVTAADFYKKNLSPTQSGCCKPPIYCGFQYENATFWEIPKSGPAVADTDCTTWSNDQTKLCYDCKSCKGGVLANIKKAWKQLLIINVSLVLFLMVVYAISCCAYKNTKSSNKNYSKYRGYP